MQLKKNPVKQALREGRTVFGLYIAVPEPTMVELAGQAGFDFIRIDISHNAYDLPTVVHMIRAAEAVGVTPMARVGLIWRRNDSGSISAPARSSSAGMMLTFSYGVGWIMSAMSAAPINAG